MIFFFLLFQQYSNYVHGGLMKHYRFSVKTVLTESNLVKRQNIISDLSNDNRPIENCDCTLTFLLTDRI